MKYSKEFIRFAYGLLFLLALSLSAYSIPVPLGIDGTVFELDGLTAAPSFVDFSVHNLNNNQLISGKIGRGSGGRYSASLSGNIGDAITVKAWNKYSQVNATLALSGVLHNVNLFLNMTYPPLAPSITSIPATAATEDQIYSYQIVALDENDDILIYALVERPGGMSINSTTGLVSWLPLQENVGNNSVKVQVSDGKFLINQSFSVFVANVNDAPRIISIPIVNAIQDVPYFYDVNAIDEDGDVLFYSLIIYPDGMEIDSSIGIISWTPGNDDIGNNMVRVEISDGNLKDEQEFSLFVQNVNDLPIITSMPAADAVQDQIYTYDVEAYDIDNDTLIYALMVSPASMTINNSTGLVNWTPGNDDVGFHNVTVKVSDSDGFALQPYSIFVQNVNDAPKIISVPVTKAKVGKTYLYDVDAIDIDNDTLTYTLLKNPGGMAININSGLINWKVKGNHQGNHNVTVGVSDGNLTDTQKFTIIVGKQNQPGPGQQLLGSSGGGGGGSYVLLSQLQQNRSRVTIEAQIHEQSDYRLKVEEIYERPKDAGRISKTVYKYLKIENIEDGEIENAVINFTVDALWLMNNDLDFEDVTLTRYHEEEWHDLNTTYLGNKNGTAYYTAITPGFSYFAISVKEGVKLRNIMAPDISVVKAPFRLTGTLYKFGKFRQADPNTRFTIQNMDTSEISEAVTGIGPGSGLYYSYVYGKKGDAVSITLTDPAKSFTAKLDDLSGFDLMINLKNDGFSGRFANAVFNAIHSKYFSIAVFSLVIAVSLGFFIRFKYRKYDN